MKDSRNRWVAEAAALLLPILVLCGPFLFTPRSLHGRDFQAFTRSRAVYAQEMTARDGEWPRWNGRQYAGTPFLGDFHGAFHYPPNILFLAMAPERALGLLFAFHMIVAAIGMYRLGRYFEFRRSAGVLGGVSYGVSFSVVAHMSTGNLAHYVVPALAPWVLLLILRMVKRVSMVRLVLLAVVVGAALLGGDPDDLPALVLLSLGLIAWTAVDAGRRKRPWRSDSILPIAVSALLGGALACATLLPSLEVRAFAAPSEPAGLARDWRILYVGVLPTLLALLPFQSPRRGPALYFAVAAGLALIPAPACSLWVAALSISGLAAMGWDGLARGRYQPKRVLRILAAAGGLALAGAGLVFWRFRILGDALVVLGLLAAAAGIVARLPARPLGIVAAVALVAADLCFFGLRSVRTVEPEDVAAAPWYGAVIGPERHEYRLCDLTTTDAAPAAYGFRLLNGFGYPRLTHLEMSMDALERMNVRWLVSSTAPPGGPWKEIAKHQGRSLYANASAQRSAYLVPAEELAPPLTIKRTANSIEVSGRSYQPGRLVVSESWMPGWKAYMYRQQVAVNKLDGVLNVEVPAGDWYVIFRYEPDAYRTGRIVSSTAVALLIGLLVAGMRRSSLAIS